MTSLNAKLFKTLCLSSLAFWMTGLLISWLFAVPSMTLLIDRGYCPPNQWQQVSRSYAQLYRQHQWRQISLQKVILFSSLSQEVLASPPLPATLATLPTYGRSDLQRQTQLQTAYPQAKLLNCR